MKVIAIITRFYEAEYQYVENVLARRLSDEHEVHIITAADQQTEESLSASSTGPSPRSTDESVRVHYLPCKKLVRNLFLANGLPNLLDTLAPDMVVTMNIGSFFAAASWSSRAFRNARRINVQSDTEAQHATFSPLMRKVWRAGFYLLKGPIFTFYLNRAHVNIGVTPDTIRILDRLRAPHVTFKLLPFDERRFNRNESLREEHRRTQKLDDGFVILIPGVLRREKQTERVIDAYLEAGRQSESFRMQSRMVVIGHLNDAYAREIMARYSANDGVSFRAVVQQDELAAWLNAGDLAIWPSLPGITLLQALATGLFVSVPDKPYFREVTRDVSCAYHDIDRQESISTALLTAFEQRADHADERANRSLAVAAFGSGAWTQLILGATDSGRN